MAILNKVQPAYAERSAFSPWRYSHQRFTFQPRTIEGAGPHSWQVLREMQGQLVNDALEHCDAMARSGHYADGDAVHCYTFGA